MKKSIPTISRSTMEELRKELDKLRERYEICEKQLAALCSIPDASTEGIMYKIKGGEKFVKSEKGSSWSLCCKDRACWRPVEGGSFCSFHKPSNKKKIYYVPLTHRTKQPLSCQYTWRYKTGKHLKGDLCSKDAQYIASDGVFLCTNHVNVYKTNKAIVYRKRDNKKLPPKLAKLFRATA